MGGLAFAAGCLGLESSPQAWAQSAARGGMGRRSGAMNGASARLCLNENPYGPPDSVLKAMNGAMQYANLYDQGDASGVAQAIARHHGVSAQNILLGAGSTEILDVADATFLDGQKQVVGVEPTFSAVYEFARGLRSNAIRLPLRPDHRQDIPAMIKAVNENSRNIGFVYLCNPNNPTGLIVTKAEIQQLLDGIPASVPVLIDEAYHHYVESADYGTSVPHVIQGRQVIVARTFSKIVGLAGMRLGYAVAPGDLISRMRQHTTGTINVMVKYGGAAGIQDTDAQAKVKAMTLDLRKKTTAELAGMGYDVIPSEANFFMVHIKREVSPVIAEFRGRGVLVGRPFPPMTQFMRVSVGTAEEMAKFTAAFKEIFAPA